MPFFVLVFFLFSAKGLKLFLGKSFYPTKRKRIVGVFKIGTLVGINTDSRDSCIGSDIDHYLVFTCFEERRGKEVSFEGIGNQGKIS